MLGRSNCTAQALPPTRMAQSCSLSSVNITDEEMKFYWFQIKTKKMKIDTRGGKYNNPYVFTEQGVAMLSTIIRTSNAARVSISIMRAFVEMRHFLMDNQDIYLSLNNINNKLDKHEVQILEHDNKFEEIFEKFNRNEEKEMIYFEGQIYDAYSKLVALPLGNSQPSTGKSAAT